MATYDPNRERMIAEAFSDSTDDEVRAEFTERRDRLRREDEARDGDRFGRIEGLLRAEGLLDEEGGSDA